jgi:hypothetical protein
MSIVQQLNECVSLTNVLPTISIMSEYEWYRQGPMSNGFDDSVDEVKSE